MFQMTINGVTKEANVEKLIESDFKNAQISHLTHNDDEVRKILIIGVLLERTIQK